MNQVSDKERIDALHTAVARKIVRDHWYVRIDIQDTMREALGVDGMTDLVHSVEELVLFVLQDGKRAARPGLAMPPETESK
jgi:hypothetical protein